MSSPRPPDAVFPGRTAWEHMETSLARRNWMWRLQRVKSKRISVRRGAPCGATWEAASRIIGRDVIGGTHTLRVGNSVFLQRGSCRLGPDLREESSSFCRSHPCCCVKKSHPEKEDKMIFRNAAKKNADASNRSLLQCCCMLFQQSLATGRRSNPVFWPLFFWLYLEAARDVFSSSISRLFTASFRCRDVNPGCLHSTKLAVFFSKVRHHAWASS